MCLARAALRLVAAHHTHTRPDELERMVEAVRRATEPNGVPGFESLPFRRFARGVRNTPQPRVSFGQLNRALLRAPVRDIDLEPRVASVERVDRDLSTCP